MVRGQPFFSYFESEGLFLLQGLRFLFYQSLAKCFKRFHFHHTLTIFKLWSCPKNQKPLYFSFYYYHYLAIYPRIKIGLLEWPLLKRHFSPFFSSCSTEQFSLFFGLWGLLLALDSFFLKHNGSRPPNIQFIPKKQLLPNPKEIFSHSRETFVKGKMQEEKFVGQILLIII